VALSPDERLVATAGKDRTARVWDVATGVPRGCFSGHTDWVLAVAFSPEGGRLLTGSADRTARLWNVAAERELRVFEDHEDVVLSVAFSPDGRQAVTGTGRNDRRLRSWDLETGALRWKQPGHRDGITSISFSPDGRRLATAAAGMEMVTPMDMDPEVRIWDVESGHEVFRHVVHSNKVFAAAFSPDGTRLVTGGATTPFAS
jgi:WD40 repeat protein